MESMAHRKLEDKMENVRGCAEAGETRAPSVPAYIRRVYMVPVYLVPVYMVPVYMVPVYMVPIYVVPGPHGS